MSAETKMEWFKMFSNLRPEQIEEIVKSRQETLVAAHSSPEGVIPLTPIEQGFNPDLRTKFLAAFTLMQEGLITIDYTNLNVHITDAGAELAGEL